MTLSSYRLRFFLVRLVNVIRPRPAIRSLTVDEVLAVSESADLVERFNAFAYASGSVDTLQWLGAPLLKNPCDLWAIVELIQELKPTAIVETGTHHGGSATFYADVARMAGVDCTVATVDVNPKWSYDPVTKGIRSIVGLSSDPSVVAKVHEAVEEAFRRREGHVLVLLDSDHSEENVTRELELYSPLVTPGSYLVVEDTNAAGARAAAERFVADRDDFAVDRSRERFLMTFFPGGWLRRVKKDAAHLEA
jgi:cephalosporin hydroxylase